MAWHAHKIVSVAMGTVQTTTECVVILRALDRYESERGREGRGREGRGERRVRERTEERT
jgi:hypothetical protein